MSANARRVAGLAGLATLAAAGVWLAFGIAGNDAFIDTATAAQPGWARGLLAGVTSSLDDDGFSVALMLMLAGYVVAVLYADVLPARPALGVVLLLIGLFAFAPPALSSDIFHYVAYARLGVLHHINPYLHGPIAAPTDPVLPFVFWRHPSSPYGPLFTLGTYPLAKLSIPAAVWTLKGVTAAAFAAAVVALSRAAPSPARAAILVGANPLLVVYGVAGGHNDLLVAALVITAIVMRSRPVSAGAALASAVAVKVTAGLALPFVVLAGDARRRVLAGLLGAAVVVAAITVAVFGWRVERTVAQIATNGHFVADYSGPDALARLLGTDVTAAIRGACDAAAGLVAIVCLWRMRHGLHWSVAATFTALAAICAVPSLEPWYIAWALPVAAVAPGRAAVVATLAVTLAIGVTRLPLLGFAPL